VQRVGIGYDVHRLVTSRPLVLGGVQIPSPVGLEGHSDADVLVHAVMDAILGAAALDDIGHFFPPDDPQYSGVSSLALLAKVRDIVASHGWSIANFDVSVVAEAPRLAPYKDQMKERLSEAAAISRECIGIKATTNEQLGFIGRGEGIAALAVALLDKNDADP
jgi:2-C-methyl-D-erythritol 2,4-cyclodiphosphate synthase